MEWNPYYVEEWKSHRAMGIGSQTKTKNPKKGFGHFVVYWFVPTEMERGTAGAEIGKQGKRGRKGKKRRRGRRKRKGKEKRKGGEEEERERKREKSRGEEEKVAAFHSFSLLSPLSSIFPPIFPPKYCLYRSRIGRYDRYSQNIGCNGQYFTEIMVILTATILRPL
eukprot:TRINITY_DN9869_c0_g1_i2.p1 TRINITY_DN9869_c0_g1~~TRINITY_DN9869_c0_g1_i2.p1  ORF type:complete len:166 (-),score=23.42 TRINITY_DN9869_c0_g1_i2:534-1031(-)